MDGFQSMQDDEPVELFSHVRELVGKHPQVQVMIGSDSHNRYGQTIYTTTVVLRYPGNGAHVLYRREKLGRIRDLWTRLWGEVERSLAVARSLKNEAGITVCRIDMDLNSDPRFASNKLHTTAVGYVKAQGYATCTKPEPLIATWAANVLCH